MSGWGKQGVHTEFWGGETSWKRAVRRSRRERQDDIKMGLKDIITRIGGG
jgi:hypothetical protein